MMHLNKAIAIGRLVMADWVVENISKVLDLKVWCRMNHPSLIYGIVDIWVFG